MKACKNLTGHILPHRGLQLREVPFSLLELNRIKELNKWKSKHKIWWLSSSCFEQEKTRLVTKFLISPKIIKKHFLQYQSTFAMLCQFCQFRYFSKKFNLTWNMYQTVIFILPNLMQLMLLELLRLFLHVILLRTQLKVYVHLHFGELWKGKGKKK